MQTPSKGEVSREQNSRIQRSAAKFTVKISKIEPPVSDDEQYSLESGDSQSSE